MARDGTDGSKGWLRREDEAKTEKVCTQCQRVLPIELFAIARANKDGRQFICRDCQSERHFDRKRRDKIPVVRVGGL